MFLTYRVPFPTVANFEQQKPKMVFSARGHASMVTIFVVVLTFAVTFVTRVKGGGSTYEAFWDHKMEPVNQDLLKGSVGDILIDSFGWQMSKLIHSNTKISSPFGWVKEDAATYNGDAAAMRTKPTLQLGSILSKEANSVGTCTSGETKSPAGADDGEKWFAFKMDKSCSSYEFGPAYKVGTVPVTVGIPPFQPAPTGYKNNDQKEIFKQDGYEKTLELKIMTLTLQDNKHYKQLCRAVEEKGDCERRANETAKQAHIIKGGGFDTYNEVWFIAFQTEDHQNDQEETNSLAWPMGGAVNFGDVLVVNFVNYWFDADEQQKVVVPTQWAPETLPIVDGPYNAGADTEKFHFDVFEKNVSYPNLLKKKTGAEGTSGR
eukprot:g4911.t1